MAGKGFFESLLDDFLLFSAVEASKDKKGRPDSVAAAAIAAGLGRTSAEDTALLGAMLGAEGAFDEEDDEESDCFCSADDDDEDDDEPDYFYSVDDDEEPDPFCSADDDERGFDLLFWGGDDDEA